MNLSHFFSLILVLLALKAQCQTILQFSVIQKPSSLTVNAGTDKTIVKGNQVKLGGVPVVSGGDGTYMYSWSPTTRLSHANIDQPIATPDSTTTYTLTVVDGKGCTQTSSVKITITTPTGLQKTNEDFLSVFPNPTKGSIHLSLINPAISGDIQIDIYDQLGRLIYSAPWSQISKDTNGEIVLPTDVKGFMTMKISGEDRYAISKLIVE